MPDILDPEATPEPKFDDLVGEGKKFSDPDALAKKVVHADQHIENLEKEMEELRGDLSQRLTMEEMLEKLDQRRQAPVQPGKDDQRNVDNHRHEPGSDEVNTVDIQAEFSKLLKQEKEKEVKTGNLEKTRAGLKERFGADYNQKLTQIAGELEVSAEFLTGMAQSSPTGFFKLIDSVAKPDDTRPVTPPNSSVDPQKNFNSTSGKKNAAFYRELRKSDPQAYYSRKIQSEMHDQALKMGPAFYE